jgi:hypothetical protein
MDKNPFTKLPPENIYNELTNETIGEVYERVNAMSEEGYSSIVLIDDMTASLKRNKFIIDTLKTMVFNRRHLHLNLIITAQSYNNIPLDLRKTISNLILFKPSKMEFEKVFEELIESKKTDAEEIMKATFQNKFDFLFVNVPTQTMFKRFDSLEVVE